jgi:hypothetical protein
MRGKLVGTFLWSVAFLQPPRCILQILRKTDGSNPKYKANRSLRNTLCTDLTKKLTHSRLLNSLGTKLLFRLASPSAVDFGSQQPRALPNAKRGRTCTNRNRDIKPFTGLSGENLPFRMPIILAYQALCSVGASCMSWIQHRKWDLEVYQSNTRLRIPRWCSVTHTESDLTYWKPPSMAIDSLVIKYEAFTLSLASNTYQLLWNLTKVRIVVIRVSVQIHA